MITIKQYSFPVLYLNDIFDLFRFAEIYKTYQQELSIIHKGKPNMLFEVMSKITYMRKPKCQLAF